MKTVDGACLSKFKLGGEMPFPVGGTNWHVMDAVNASIDECNTDDILSENEDGIDNVMLSFKPKKSLNPHIFPNKHINSRVRLRLLDIADDFIDFLNVKWADTKDIILMGSLANYNWSKFSDFDLHIIMDFKDVDERVEFVREFFDSKKKLWNKEHENLKIYGFPVELYVQDVNDEYTATGVYSLEKNKWLKEPESDNFKRVKLNTKHIEKKAISVMSKIDSIEENAKNENDLHKCKLLLEKLLTLLNKLKGLRKDGLIKDGEMSEGNILYKTIRRLGYLDKIFKIKNHIYDKINSIE